MQYSAFMNEDRPLAALLPRLGARVRAARLQRRWSIADLARRSGLSARYVSELELGEGNISVLRLAEVAVALDVSLASMFAGLGPIADDVDALAALPPARRMAALRAGRAPSKVALVGLRGAGKTSVGARVSEMARYRFVEADQAVEERAGVPLAELFEIGGTARYRAFEREILLHLLDLAEPLVIATGGSVVTAADTWSVLRASARTVWLRASPGRHLARVEAQGDLRPMRGRANALAELETILAARSPFYAQAEVHVETDDRDLESVAREVVEALGLEEGAPLKG